MVAKVKNKLSNWKIKLLSFVGPVCLIKLAIFAISLYFLSFFKVLKSVCNELTKIQMKFSRDGVLRLKR